MHIEIINFLYGKSASCCDENANADANSCHCAHSQTQSQVIVAHALVGQEALKVARETSNTTRIKGMHDLQLLV